MSSASCREVCRTADLELERFADEIGVAQELERLVDTGDGDLVPEVHAQRIIQIRGSTNRVRVNDDGVRFAGGDDQATPGSSVATETVVVGDDAGTEVHDRGVIYNAVRKIIHIDESLLVEEPPAVRIVAHCKFHGDERDLEIGALGVEGRHIHAQDLLVAGNRGTGRGL